MYQATAVSSQWELLHKYVKCHSGVIRDRPAIHGTRNAETVAQRARQNGNGWASASSGTRVPTLAVSSKKEPNQTTNQQKRQGAWVPVPGCLYMRGPWVLTPGC